MVRSLVWHGHVVTGRRNVSGPTLGVGEGPRGVRARTAWGPNHCHGGSTRSNAYSDDTRTCNRTT